MSFIHRLVICLSSALSLALAFPPYSFFPMAMVSYGGFLFCIHKSDMRGGFYLGLIYGSVGYGVTLWWFYGVFGIANLVLYTILGIFIGLFSILHIWIQQRGGPALFRLVLVASWWTAIEFYRCEYFILRFPWVTPGTALGPTWISPWVGVYGTSFLVIASLLMAVWKPGFIWSWVGIATCIALGTFRPPAVVLPSGALGTAVIQSESSDIDVYYKLSTTLTNQNVHLIVWPEYAIPYDVRKNEKDLRLLHTLCSDLDCILVVGTQTLAPHTSDHWYNTALTLDQEKILGEHYKMRPVHFFHDGIPGKSLKAIATPHGTLGTPICFDCDNSTICRQLTSSGAQAFAVPIYDATDWSRTQHLQHAALMNLRAAENARWFACSASSGISQFIDSHGVTHKSLPPFIDASLVYGLPMESGLTFFTRYGWCFPWVCLYVATGHLVWVFATPNRSRFHTT